MSSILIYVGLAFMYYCLCVFTGKEKVLKPHLIFAVLGFGCEARAIFLMNERFDMLKPDIPEWLLITHIALSAWFLFAALALIVSGICLYLRRRCEIKRYIHKNCVWFFFIMWFFATCSGLLILY